MNFNIYLLIYYQEAWYIYLVSGKCFVCTSQQGGFVFFPVQTRKVHGPGNLHISPVRSGRVACACIDTLCHATLSPAVR